MNKDFMEALPLATVGAMRGAWEYYKPELMWAAVGAGILAYDLLCSEGQTLSESFRKQSRAKQIGELALLSGHLLNVAPNYDPIHRTFKFMKGTS